MNQDVVNQMLEDITSRGGIDAIVDDILNTVEDHPRRSYTTLRKHAQMIHIYKQCTDDQIGVIGRIMKDRLHSAILSALNTGITEIALQNI